MTSGVYQRKNVKRGLARKSKFRRNLKDLKEFLKENDVRLSDLSKYMRRRNNKKARKETVSNEN